ncbi:MAG: chromosome segregation protein SMC [Clostridia bacterium]|nr:chromosome segregation protein SMC [Clostridia bacterium]
MYLQRIELHGFKSFVNKVSIKLDKGITVIVGPNGSGKSNIVDSLRWVLGETSVKSLRGSKLEDVIFSGTKNRKPMGMAEVTIVLDNSSGLYPMDYNEITVTRKVFRDGESQFLINKNHCRLKDVQSLFMDTGIGKNAFAIIGQGKIDHIISSSPEERRPLFEEVAGITKYKHRKKEAEQKLSVTEQSLLRIGDIVYEIEEQLPALKIEAEIAQEYLRKLKVLESVEYQYLRLEKEKLQKRLDTITSNYCQNNSLVISYGGFLSELDRYIFNEKFILDKCQDKISTIINLVGEMNSETERYLGEEKVLREKVNGLLREIEVIKTDRVIQSSEVNNWTKNVEVLRGDINNANMNLLQLQKKLDGINIDVNNLQVEMEDNEKLQVVKNNFLVDHQAILAQYKNDIAKLETRISLLKKQRDKITEQLTDRETKLDSLNGEEQKIAIEAKELQQIYEEIVESIQTNKNKIESLEVQKEQIKNQRDTIEKDLYKINSRLNFLKELEKDMEGYFPGVKSILIAKRNNPEEWAGIVGSVADIITAPSELVLPIEVAVGSQLQNLITVSSEDAKKAIAYLKTNKSGKVTFLPLNTIQCKPFEIPQKHKNASGLIGMGYELIKSDAKFAVVVRYLLGRVLIVEDLNKGLVFAKEFNYSLKIVSLDGQMVMPGGSITGGFIKTSSSNLLSRKTEITTLIKEKDPLERDLKKRNEEFNRLIALKTAFTDRDKELLQKANDLREKMQQKGNILHIIKEKISTVKDEISVYENELELVNSSELENQALVSDTEKKVLEIESQINDLTLEMDMIKDQSKKILEQINCLVNIQHQVQIEKSIWDQKLNQLEEKVDDYLSRIAAYKAKMEINDQKLHNNKAEIVSINNTIEYLGTRIAKLLKERETMVNMKQQLIESKDFLSNRLMLHEKVQTQVNGLYQEVSKRQHQLELERARIEANLDSMTSTMEEKFSGNFTPMEIGIKNYKLEVESLKGEIAALGQVNIGAIEHYQKLTERIHFLQNQKEDLLKGKEALEKVIKEIDSIIEERFSQTFARVSQEFSAIFKYLFGGGSASIYVTNEENLLNTGVDIEAQPPGKKLQNITLLSGGEKALTAIALLFAFLKVKPSPFCVLDEIETSLDETNEQRFSQFLRELSNSTQFLIVSHRQNTMLAADNLYGITTEEPGVSKVVSVKLSDNLAAV